MESNDLFKQHLNGLDEKKAALLNDKADTERKISLLSDQRESAIILVDKETVGKITDALIDLNRKLADIDNAIDNLNPVPLAERLYQDCQAEFVNLVEKSNAQWVNCVAARENFLKEIELLASIKVESNHLKDMSGEAGRFLRRNPIDGLNIRGQHILAVDLKLINRILR